MERKMKDYALLTLKGICMGAADVVPGVSGGTIAFIVGIYDELIDSIKSINRESLKMFFTGRWKTFWRMIITWLLVAYPILVWAFFFGLVLASTWFVGKDIKEWNWKTVTGFVLGAAIAYYITVATPAETPSNLLFIFLCGAIAICAMILPGISGSFILVLLGKYFFVMEAVKTLNMKIIIVFAAGAFLGITSFSRVLSYALKRFRNITLSVLTGFMLGSLNKVWPWKETVETFVDSHGVTKPLIEVNAVPDQSIFEAIVLAIVGFFLVYVLEKLSSRKSADN